jgi:hypothetical protein
MLYSYAECTCLLKNMAVPDISDYEFDADDLLLMSIIIPPAAWPASGVSRFTLRELRGRGNG